MSEKSEPAAAPAVSGHAVLTRRGARVVLVALVVLAVAAGFLAEVHKLSRESGLVRLETAAQATAQARALGLSSEIARQRSVAAILARDRDVIEGLAAPEPERAVLLSDKFAALRPSAGSSVLYLVDATGTAIAASNRLDADSFVGANYRFRTYFSEAMALGTGEEYALGSVSHRPGLYLSERVERGGRLLGAVIVKVEFDDLEKSWQQGGGRTVVRDAAGQVALTSEGSLRFAPVPVFGPQRLVVEQPVAGIGWTLVMALPIGDVERQAMANTLLAGFAIVLLAFVAIFVQRRRRRALNRAAAERRYREDLERDVAERTHALSGEIREREAAELRLASMQARLVQANRLAALGQITAGVAHEVNQPLATIRLLAENAQAMLETAGSEAGNGTGNGAGNGTGGCDPAGVEQNLAQIVKMSERIETITSELRGFSRKARGGHEPVSLAEAWEASMLLSASRRVADRVRLVAPRIPPGLMVLAEKVRLEQVLVNLLQNAHEALSEVATPETRGAAGSWSPEIRVDVRLWQENGQKWVTVTVADNGPGLDPEVAENLFQPFLTTKAQGLGLGLVISRDIMRDFGGKLRVDPFEPGRGARFHIDLKGA